MAKISSEQLRNVEKVQPFSHSEAPKNIFLGQSLLIFPVLGKLTHMYIFLCRVKKYKIDFNFPCEENIGQNLHKLRYNQ